MNHLLPTVCLILPVFCVRKTDSRSNYGFLILCCLLSFYHNPCLPSPAPAFLRYGPHGARTDSWASWCCYTEKCVAHCGRGQRRGLCGVCSLPLPSSAYAVNFYANTPNLEQKSILRYHAGIALARRYKHICFKILFFDERLRLYGHRASYSYQIFCVVTLFPRSEKCYKKSYKYSISIFPNFTQLFLQCFLGIGILLNPRIQHLVLF